MTNKKKSILQNFLSSDKQYPITTAIAAGLYPMLFYYSNNFTLVNTWGHLAYFTTYFLLIPSVLFLLVNRVSKLKTFNKIQKFVLPFLNVFTFLFLLKVCLYAGLHKKIILGIFILSGLIAFFLFKYLKKIIIIQFILIFIGFLSLIPVLIKQVSHNEEWMLQPDAIENVVFKKKPNVYFIQPDGYVNFSELNKGYYNIDTSNFENFLIDNNFTNYPSFRTNYATTLSSNSATFSMKHHYYHNGSSVSELINARKVIISKNPTLTIFKNNGYKTHFITEKPYLLLNRPKMGYKYCNFSYNEIDYLGTGLKATKDILPSLKKILNEKNEQSLFFFIEIFSPGHIANSKSNTKGRDIEKQKWITSLEVANKKLTDVVSFIKQKDSTALIIIMADHGGYVGLDYTGQIYNKTEDRDLIYSMFSSQLSIHWPFGNPEFDTNFKTPINLFRYIFTYLSEDKTYLQNLEEDATYTIINEGAAQGIYKCINANGDIVFEKKT